MDLGGWDVVSSIQLEHLNGQLTRAVKGASFAAQEDGAKIAGRFQSWALHAEGSAVTLAVTIENGEVALRDRGSFTLKGMTVRFPVDFTHLAATAADPRDLLKLSFQARGLGPGDTSDMTIALRGAELERLPKDTRDLIRAVAGALTVNAILADARMAGLPIAVLMQKGSVHADWYRPTKVAFALSALKNGMEFASILVSIRDQPPANLPAQPPAELHSRPVNMAFSRELFLEHVIIHSVKEKLGSAASKVVRLPLAAFMYADVPLSTTLAGAASVVATFLTPGTLAPNIALRVTSSVSFWERDEIKTTLSGECALDGWASLAWFEFTGKSTMKLGFDATAQRLTSTLTSNPPALGKRQGLAKLDFISGDPQFDTGRMAAAVCGLRDFPPPANYSFEWAGAGKLVFDRADFQGDVYFGGHPEDKH